MLEIIFVKFKGENIKDCEIYFYDTDDGSVIIKQYSEIKDDFYKTCFCINDTYDFGNLFFHKSVGVDFYNIFRKKFKHILTDSIDSDTLKIISTRNKLLGIGAYYLDEMMDYAENNNKMMVYDDDVFSDMTYITYVFWGCENYDKLLSDIMASFYNLMYSDNISTLNRAKNNGVTSYSDMKRYAFVFKHLVGNLRFKSFKELFDELIDNYKRVSENTTSRFLVCVSKGSVDLVGLFSNDTIDFTYISRSAPVEDGVLHGSNNDKPMTVEKCVEIFREVDDVFLIIDELNDSIYWL